MSAKKDAACREADRTITESEQNGDQRSDAPSVYQQNHGKVNGEFPRKEGEQQ